jgi:hypothetical protein
MASRAVGAHVRLRRGRICQRDQNDAAARVKTNEGATPFLMRAALAAKCPSGLARAAEMIGTRTNNFVRRAW